VTSLQQSPTFAPPATPFLASSPDIGDQTRQAAAALFGAPLDLTESFRSGARGGPAATRYMSEGLETYSPTLDRDLEELECRDLGDLQIQDITIDAALHQISLAMEHAAKQARLAVMLGGEHTGSLGGFRGLKRVYPEAVILQADAHLDMRPDYDGQSFTHATWLNHVGREFGFNIVHQVGLRSGDRQEWNLARHQTAWSSTELSLPLSVRERIGHHPVYLSIDIDVLDPAHAPARAAPSPAASRFASWPGSSTASKVYVWWPWM
jgi:agmatinase